MTRPGQFSKKVSWAPVRIALTLKNVENIYKEVFIFSTTKSVYFLNA
jgi:hypothetical protein